MTRPSRWFFSIPLTVLGLAGAVACSDDGPAAPDDPPFTLELHNEIRESVGDPTFAPRFTLVPTAAFSAQEVVDIEGITIEWPGGVDMGEPGFGLRDGVDVRVLQGSPRDEPLPDGVYSVTVRFFDGEVVGFDEEHAVPLLGSTSELSLDQNPDAWALHWTGPGSEHDWQVELWEVVSEEPFFQLEFRETVASGASAGGEAISVERDYASFIEPGDGFGLVLVLMDEHNTRRIDISGTRPEG